jgi:predicted PurR-regulated permease PerM
MSEVVAKTTWQLVKPWLGTAFNGIMGLGIVVSLIMGGVDVVKQKQGLQDQVDQLTKNNSDYTEQYKQITQSLANDDANIQKQIGTVTTQYTNMQGDLETAVSNFQKSYKTLQMIGIIIVVVVFFLLLLKHYGIY